MSLEQTRQSIAAWIIHYSDRDDIVANEREADDRADCGILVTPLVPVDVAENRCACGHQRHEHDRRESGSLWCRCCPCADWQENLAEPVYPPSPPPDNPMGPFDV